MLYARSANLSSHSTPDSWSSMVDNNPNPNSSSLRVGSAGGLCYHLPDSIDLSSDWRTEVSNSSALGEVYAPEER